MALISTNTMYNANNDKMEDIRTPIFIICIEKLINARLLVPFLANLIYIVALNFTKTASLYQLPSPVRIRVRIDPPHPLVCHKRRLNGAILRMRPEKPRPRVTAGVAR
jgi:hypothetical protein